MFIRSRQFNSENWTPWYKIGTYEISPYWQDSTVSYAHGVVVNSICDLRVKVRITSSSWHDLLRGLPEAAENFTFWWNSQNYKPGKFSMNGDTLACRADQVDDYDVHMTYAIKMQDLKLALVVVAENVTSTRAFLCQLLDQLIYLVNDIIHI